MKDWLNRIISDLFGEQTIYIDREEPTRSVQTKPNILQKLRGMWGDYVPPKQEVSITPTQQPTATPTPTPMPTAKPTGLASGYMPAPSLAGFKGEYPGDELANLIQIAATEQGIDPALLAALLYQESRFNPEAFNPNYEGSYGPDYGIAQINLQQHPDVTQQQAYDPQFAVPWAAKYLAQSMGQYDDINRAVASYNVGRGGANVQGPEPFGGGPLGQTYLNNVARNLELDLINQLGLKVTPDLLAEY